MPKHTQTPKAVFAIPFTRDELRQDILNIYLLQLRTTALIAEEEMVWALTKKPLHHAFGLVNPNSEPCDLGLSFYDIRETELAKALEQQYDYGFFGVVSVGREAMDYETIHTWVAAYLMDLKSSQMVAESESYGGANLATSILRCLHTCELANARRVLEGSEPFSHFTGLPGDKDSDATAFEALTVRQMALLSGMEEMTIRTAVSRKSAFPLETYKEDRRTLINTEVAKAWLMAKGRYVPITRQWYGSELDLAKTKFTSIQALSSAIDERTRQFELRAAQQGDVRKEIAAAFEAQGYELHFICEREPLRNPDLMSRIALILELPAPLLVLRAREAALHDELSATENEVRQAMQAATPQINRTRSTS